MLVLSRKKNEVLCIGDDIQITIIEIRGDKVRIGITAPPTVPVHRLEVFKAIKRNQSAAVDFDSIPHPPAPSEENTKAE